MERGRLGSSALDVSRLSLGSWRTFERIGREQGLSVMRAAREHGINFLDDARYNNETGTAPIPTGYSEVLFGQLFRAAGWERSDTIVSNKLWWEFWPREDAAAELDGSLARMGFEYVDLIYANPPPNDLAVPDMVAAVGELVSSGKARAWAIVNWEAAPLLEASGAGVVASFVIAGGVLTGKYESGAAGRAAGQLDEPQYAAAVDWGRRLGAVAEEVGVSAAALAIAFALRNPAVTSVLFGATSPSQIVANVAALDVVPDVLERLDSLVS